MAEKAQIVIAATDATGPAFASAQRNFQQLQAGAAGVAAKVAGLAAAVVAGAEALNHFDPRPILDAADQLAKLSQRTGVAVETLSAYQYAGKLADVTTEDLADSLKKLNVNIAAAARGEQVQAEAFRAIGIAVTDSSGKVRTADKVFEDLADRFASYEDGANKVALANAIGGRSFEKLIPLLNGGSQGLKDARKEAEQLGVILGEDLAKKAEQFNDNVTRLSVASDGLKVAIAGGVIQALVDYSNEAVNAAKNSDLLGFSLGKLGDLFSGKLLREFAFGKSVQPDALRAQQQEVERLTNLIAGLQINLDRDPGNTGLIRRLDVLSEKLRKAQHDLTGERAGGGRGFVNPALVVPDPERPKPQAPALPGTNTASEAAALQRKQLDGRLKVLQDHLEKERDLFQFAEGRLAESFNAGELNIRNFYDEKARAADAFLAKQGRTFDALIAQQREYQKKAATPAERQDAENKIAEFEAQRARVYREADQAAQVAQTQRTRAVVEFERALADLDAQMAELSGDRYGAELLRNAQQFADARRLMRKGDADPAREALLQRLLKAQADFNKVQDDSARISERAQIAEETFLIQAERSGASRQQIEQGIRELREGALRQLDGLISRTEDLVVVSQNPDLLAYLERLRLARERAFDEKDPGLLRFNDLAKSAAVSISDAFEDAVFSSDKLSDNLKNLATQLQRMVFRDTVTEPLSKAISGAIKGAGSSGGIGAALFGAAGNFFSGLFGGTPMATGTNYVPRDNFPALLHKGEAVIPAEYNPALGAVRAQSAAPGNTQTFNFKIDARGADPGVAAQIEQGVVRAVRLSLSAVQSSANRGGSFARAVGRR